MNDYSSLRPVFFRFLREKDEEAENWKDEKDPLAEPLRTVRGLIDPYFARKFNFTFKDDEEANRLFASHVMDGWKHLPEPQLRGLLWEISFYLGRTKGYRLRLEPLEHPKAIDWLWVDIHCLGLKNLKLFMTPDEKFAAYPPDLGMEFKIDYNDFARDWERFPSLQCAYCGKVYFEKGKRKAAKKRAQRCHLDTCDTSSPTLTEDNHQKGCCFGDWTRINNAFSKARLNRAYKKSQNEAIAVFSQFLEKRFEKNKKKDEKVLSSADWQIMEAIKSIGSLDKLEPHQDTYLLRGIHEVEALCIKYKIPVDEYITVNPGTSIKQPRILRRLAEKSLLFENPKRNDVLVWFDDTDQSHTEILG